MRGIGRRPARLGLSRWRQGIKTGPLPPRRWFAHAGPDHVTQTEEHEHCTIDMLTNLPESRTCGVLGYPRRRYGQAWRRLKNIWRSLLQDRARTWQGPSPLPFSGGGEALFGSPGV